MQGGSGKALRVCRDVKEQCIRDGSTQNVSGGCCNCSLVSKVCTSIYEDREKQWQMTDH